MDTMTAKFLQQVLLNAASMGGLFQDLDRQALDDLMSVAEMAPFDAGALVFGEGATGDLMYVVVSGRVEVFRKDAAGREVRLAVLAEGDAFGEIAILEHVRRTASVRAQGPTVTLALSRQALARHPELTMHLYRNIARMLARRLRLTTDELLSYETRAHLEKGGKQAG